MDKKWEGGFTLVELVLLLLIIGLLLAIAVPSIFELRRRQNETHMTMTAVAQTKASELTTREPQESSVVTSTIGITPTFGLATTLFPATITLSPTVFNSLTPTCSTTPTHLLMPSFTLPALQPSETPPPPECYVYGDKDKCVANSCYWWPMFSVCKPIPEPTQTPPPASCSDNKDKESCSNAGCSWDPDKKVCH